MNEGNSQIFKIAMKIQLNNKQFEYLKSNLLLDRNEFAAYFDSIAIHHKYLIDIPENSLDEIRDWAGEQLQKVGFNEKYELTDDGKILEQLIDLFFI